MNAALIFLFFFCYGLWHWLAAKGEVFQIILVVIFLLLFVFLGGYLRA
jgi:hypothetical protein